MRSSTLVAFLAAATIGFSFAGCNCGGPPPVVEPDASTQPDGSTQQPNPDSGTPIGQCVQAGLACSDAPGSAACCSGVCQNGTCGEATNCAAIGGSCQDANDCCNSTLCVSGKCTSNRCVDNGAVCSVDSECCTGNCDAANRCAPVNTTTTDRVLGQSCADDLQCASRNCQGGFCVPQSSCRADYDICRSNDECCNTNCSSKDGVTAGYCIPLSGGCKVAGAPCTAFGECCSKTCADQGFGVNVCAAAGGCQIEDSPCDNAAQCCNLGSAPKVPTCEAKPSAPDATLCTVGGCNPVGMVCGKATLADGGTVTVNARAPTSCCDDVGQGRTCKVDRAGIPRCFGGSGLGVDCPTGYTGEAGCCIAQGEQCAFSDQCCDGSPCLPDESGVLRCAARATCKPLGESCNPTASECCAGTVCPSGELSVCQLPPSGDAGTTPTCKPNGTGAESACTTGAECCSLTCTGGFCGVPDACQPQGETCTASADCCTGLSCNIPAGATVGTCATAVCQSAGQTCTNTLGCCNGLACRDAAGVTCAPGTTGCSGTCRVILE